MSAELDYKLAPGDSSVAIAWCQELSAAGRVEEALPVAERLAAMLPRFGGAHSVLGGVLAELGRHQEALRHLDLAVKLSPGIAAAHWNRSLTRLTLGDYRGGFEDYRWGICNRQRRIRTLKPAISASDYLSIKGGRILIWGEQGYGDQIMMARFLPWLRWFCPNKTFIFEVHQDLVPLFCGQGLANEIVARPDDDCHPCDFDEHISVHDLPWLLDVENDEKLWRGAYIGVQENIELDLKPGGNYGFIWHGQPAHPNDHRRSLKREEAEDLASRLSGVTLWNLQYQEEALPGCEEFGLHLNDWLHTAEALKALDGLISIDTGAVHLAGAMGRPVHLLLPTHTDWRWGLKGSLTNWYPSVTMHRQATAGEWGPAFESVARALSLCGFKAEWPPKVGSRVLCVSDPGRAREAVLKYVNQNDRQHPTPYVVELDNGCRRCVGINDLRPLTDYDLKELDLAASR